MKLNFGFTRVAPRLVLSSLAYLSLMSPFALAESTVPAKVSSKPAQVKQTPAPAQRLAGAEQPAKARVLPQPVASALPDTQSKIGPTIDALLGKATLIRLPEAIERISVANPAIADDNDQPARGLPARQGPGHHERDRVGQGWPATIGRESGC
jgi:Flp pilus assembly secretin CpaC